MTPNIPIVAWAPDADPTIPGVLANIENLLPTARGYAPEFSLQNAGDFSATFSEEIHGAQTLRFGDGNAALFAGSNSNLYVVLSGSGAQVRSRSGGYTFPSQSFPWRFASFSTTTQPAVALAVQYGTVLQATTSYATSNFADVPSAPSADTIAVNRNFVVLGHLSTRRDGWICSAIESYTNWTPDIATQCAQGLLTATPGAIVRLIAFRDYIIAFKGASMYRGTYVGAAQNTWAWPVISTRVGLVSHDAVCEVAGVLYWLAFDGFYRWAGGAIERIASAPFEWLFNQTSGDNLLSFSVQCIYDPARQVVRWSFIDYASPDRMCLSYHIATNRWGLSYLPMQLMFTLPYAGVPTVVGNNVALVSDAPGYISRINNAIQVQTGPPAASSFTTGDIGDDDQVFDLSRMRVRYLTAPTTSTATHFTRKNLGDGLSVVATRDRDDGKYDLTDAARWHRVKFQQTGKYEVSGFRAETPKAGKR